MATFAGSVQGVVVQMTMLALPAEVRPLTIGNFTKIAGSVAVGVFHLRLRERGLRAGAPVDRLLRLIDEPFSTKLAKARMISAS